MVAKPRLCRNRRFCPRCSYFYSKQRADYAFSIFKELAEKLRKITGKKIFFIFEAYVLPIDLQHPSNMSRFNEAVRIVISPGFGVMNGGARSIHFFQRNGNNNPLSRLYLHAYVVSLNVRWNKERGRFEIYDPSDEDELTESSWRAALHEAFDGYEAKSNRPLTYCKIIEFSKENEPEIKKLLMYAFKSPLVDLADTNWDEVSDDEARLFRFIAGNKYNRISWFGYLADCVKSKYLAKLDIQLKKLKEFIASLNKCPLCKSPLKPLSKEDIDQLGLDGMDPPNECCMLVFKLVQQKPLSEFIKDESYSSKLESLKKMNPLMPEWMIEEFLKQRYPGYSEAGMIDSKERRTG